MRRRDGSLEGREFIRSIGWGVRDSLNCRRSRENISIKVFYNRASLGLTFLASRREGGRSGGGGEAGVRMRLKGVGGVGVGGEREKEGITRIQTVSLKRDRKSVV